MKLVDFPLLVPGAKPTYKTLPIQLSIVSHSTCIYTVQYICKVYIHL